MMKAMPLASPHIGSGPGVVGESAMQVKLLVPLRSSRMVPSAPMSIIVAPSAMALGAAVMALSIFSASVALAVSSLPLPVTASAADSTALVTLAAASLAVLAAGLQATRAITETPANANAISFTLTM